MTLSEADNPLDEFKLAVEDRLGDISRRVYDTVCMKLQQDPAGRYLNAAMLIMNDLSAGNSQNGHYISDYSYMLDFKDVEELGEILIEEGVFTKQELFFFYQYFPLNDTYKGDTVTHRGLHSLIYIAYSGLIGPFHIPMGKVIDTLKERGKIDSPEYTFPEMKKTIENSRQLHPDIFEQYEIEVQPLRDRITQLRQKLDGGVLPWVPFVMENPRETCESYAGLVSVLVNYRLQI